MEESITQKRKENNELSLSLKKLKSRQNVKGKELQTNNIMKKFPHQINSLTDEIKNIMGKKQDFITKITNNKKSLNNLRSILSNIEKNYNHMLTSKSFQKTVDNLSMIRIIDESLKNYKTDLDLPEDELINKINNNDTFNKFQNLRVIMSPKITRKKVLGIDSMNIPNKNLYINKNNKNTLEEKDTEQKNTKLLLPKILNNNYDKAKRSLSPYKGIFNKYEYLNKKDKNNNLTSSIKNKNLYSVNLKKKPELLNKKDNDRSNDDILENSDEGKYLLKFIF